MSVAPYSDTVWEDSTPTLLARVEIDRGGDADPVQQADLSSATYKVFRKGSDTPTASGTLTISAVIYDTLQTGTIWTVDTTGYNFLYTLAATAFPEPGSYTAEVKFVQTSGAVGFLVFNLTALSVLGS